MTVSSSTNVVILSADGSAHSFAFTFKIFAASDLKVIVRSTAGVETVKTLNSHYIIADSSVGNASGGNVLFKFNTSVSSDAHYSTTDYRPASGEKVILRREIPQTQELDLVDNDPFSAILIEEQLDKVVMQIHGVQEAVDRSIKFSRSNLLDSSGSAIASTYPEIEDDTTARANKLLSFDSTGVPIATQEIGTLKGNWAASTVYQERDIVKDTSNNNIYIVNEAHSSTGSQPLSTNANASKYTVIIDTGANVTLTATGAITGGSLVADNVTIDGNTITTTDTNGNLIVTPNGSGVVHFDGSLEVEGNDSSTSNTVTISPSSGGGDDIFLTGSNPWVAFYDDSTSSVPRYGGGTVGFYGKNASGSYIQVGAVEGYQSDATDGSVDGGIRITGASNNSQTAAILVNGADVTISGDLTVSGDDITMGTNTAGYLLVADGTNYNPVAVSGDVTMASSGAVTIASGAVENAMLAGSIADSKLSTITTADKVSGAAVQIDGATDGTSITIADTDKLLIDDGGTTKYINASQLNTYTSASVAADDLATGDAAVTLTTTSGNITIDAAANNSNIILKGTDGSADTTFLTISGGDAGAATFNSTVTATGFIIGSADINENDLEAIDGVVAGVVSASKVVTVDSSKDFSGARNITLTGELDAGSLDVSGDADIAGTTNLDNTDIDGTLVVDGSNISLDSTSTLNIDNSNTSNGITIGTATSGVPVSIGHSTSEVTINDNLNVTGNFTVSGTTTTVNSTVTTVVDPILTIGSNSSDDNKDRGLEFKYNDGSARVGFFGYDDSASAFTVFTAATNSSEVFSGTTGNAIFGNVTGTLQTAAQTNITSVGALDGGSITSGFGNINNGSSTITTTGAITGGTITGTNITLGTTLEPWGANSHVIQLGDGTVDNGALAWNTISGGDHFDLMYQCYFDGTNFKYAAGSAAVSRISQYVGAINFDRKAGGTNDATFTWDRSMSIDANGNVLIGNGVSHVDVNTGPDITIGTNGNSDTDGSAIGFVHNGNALNAYIGGQKQFLTMGTYTSTPFRLITANTERMRIESSGQVLCGSTTADSHIKILSAGTNTTNYIALRNTTAADSSGARYSYINYEGTQSGGEISTLAQIGAEHQGTADDEKGNLVFTTNDGNDGDSPNERMRIGNNGRITSTTIVDDWNLVLSNGNSAPYGQSISWGSAAPDNNTSIFLYCADSSVARLYIYADGDVVNHDNSYGSISDERIKQDIVDANSQWDDIKAVKVRNYKKKDDVEQYGDKAGSQIGVIAQELEAVSPKLVKEASPSASDIRHSAEFGTLYEDGDTIPDGKEVGDVKEIKENVKKVSYSVLYMKAIKALQEAMTRIETLEAKVAALEGS